MTVSGASTDFSLNQPRPDTLSVSGALNFNTATRVLEDAGERLSSGKIRTLDLQDVQAVDSAGLACVLALMAQAHQQGGQLEVCQVPEGMSLLAQVCDADHLLLSA